MGVNNGSRARMYLHFRFTPARSGGASGRLFAERAHARAARVTLPTDIIMVVAEDAQRSSPPSPPRTGLSGAAWALMRLAQFPAARDDAVLMFCFSFGAALAFAFVCRDP